MTTSDDDNDVSLQLAQACMDGDVQAFESLLSATDSSSSPLLLVTPIPWKDSDGKEFHKPPIFIAVDYEHVPLLQCILNQATPEILNYRDENDYSPLHWACAGASSLEIVQLLLQAGAKADDEALDLAKNNEKNSADIVQLLMNSPTLDLYSTFSETDIYGIFIKACREGDLIKVQELLTNHSYDTLTDPQHQEFNPLAIAMRNGHMEIVQLLQQEHGATIENHDFEQTEAANTNHTNQIQKDIPTEEPESLATKEEEDMQ